MATATPGASVPVPAEGQQPGDWLRFGFDAARSGVNPNESRISPANVGSLHRLWQVRLPGVADSSPILLHALPMSNGATRDLLYLTTLDGRLLAVDAANGHIVWQQHPSGPKITNSSPVADPARQFVFAYGLDGALHKYAAATGAEVTGNGWPVTITRMRETEKESAAINLEGSRVYVVTSGYIGDAPPYQGHIVTVDATTGDAHVFNCLCSPIPRLLTASDCNAERSGIWSRGGAVIDPQTGNIYVTTGNGPYDESPQGQNWGDSVLELSPDGTRLLDSYTPADYAALEEGDTDLGSDAPALLPQIPGSKTPLLLVQGGKDAIIRLLNRQNLSGQGGPGHTGGEVQSFHAQGCATFTQPVVESDGGTVRVIIAGTCGMDAYIVRTDVAGNTSLAPAWHSADVTTTPVLAGGVLFAAGSGAVHAYDPRTGKVLWSSTNASAGGTIGDTHWESPIVANGVLYVPDHDGKLTAYGL